MTWRSSLDVWFELINDGGKEGIRKEMNINKECGGRIRGRQRKD